jgi:hypothetical protein
MIPELAGKLRRMRSFFRSDPQWKRVVAVGVAAIGVEMATRFISNALVADAVLVLAAAGFFLFLRARYRRVDQPPPGSGRAPRRRRR